MEIKILITPVQYSETQNSSHKQEELFGKISKQIFILLLKCYCCVLTVKQIMLFKCLTSLYFNKLFKVPN